MTFSWNNGNVDAGLKLRRWVDVVCVTLTQLIQALKKMQYQLNCWGRPEVETLKDHFGPFERLHGIGQVISSPSST
jgi:hypothetical protein